MQLCTSFNMRKLFRQKWREMSMGEAVDKMVILDIKMEMLEGTIPIFYMLDMRKQREEIYRGVYKMITKDIEVVFNTLLIQLTINNRYGWNAENAVMEATTAEGAAQAAKDSRDINLHRAELKRKIDELFSEEYLEIKKYSDNKQLE